MRGVARRWVADFTENAKVPAWAWEFPEAGHNAVMTLASEAPRTLPMTWLALGYPREPAARRRWRSFLETVAAHGGRLLTVEEPHADPWLEALGLAHVGDWVSTALAERHAVDVSSLSLMDDFKARLAAAEREHS
jgi:hypothetical protein